MKLECASSREANPAQLEQVNPHTFESTVGSFLMLNVRLVPLASVVTPHNASAISIVAFWCVTKMNCVP